MESTPTPISQLASTELEAYDLDIRHHTFEAALRALEYDRARRFVLRCTGVRRFTFRSDDPGELPDEVVDVTAVTYAPTAEGATRVMLELWAEKRGWIEITCASLEVREQPAANG